MIFFRNFLVKKPCLRFSTRKSSQLEPVRLAYASYESTNPSASPQPSLLVNHGLFGSKGNWNSLCKVYHSKTNRKVLAVDARNHGDSPHTTEHNYELLASDLKNLIEQLKFQKVALLGHSMGGRTVMYFALKYPHLVEKLIVADISPVSRSPHFQSMPSLFEVLKSVDLPKDGALSVVRAQVDSQLAEQIDDKDLRGFLLTNLVHRNGSYTWRINIPTLVSNFEKIAQFPPIPDTQFKGPVLFMGGGESDFLPKSDHDQIRKMFPKAEFQYIEGAGHWLHAEKPAQFLETTIDFLNRTE